MDESYQLLVRNRLQQLQLEIQQILDLAGDSSRLVRLIAVTKYIDSDVMSDLVQAGITDAGENRWQVAREKVVNFPQVQWHFIGPLQRNKARYVARHFSWVHSVNGFDLAQDLSKYALEFDKSLKVLLQINISGEEQKFGVPPDEALGLLEDCAMQKGITVQGLMGIAHHTNDETTIRSEFRALKTLRDELQLRAGIQLPELSMGMSADYPIALAEGATMLRIGRKLILKEGLAQ